MEKPICYILSGLGADQRVFDQIDFGSKHKEVSKVIQKALNKLTNNTSR
ncbi:hypothetical protein [Fluviicola taffensis]